MGRYRGPVCKLCRREGEKLLLRGDRCGSSKCALEKRAYAPGSSPTARKKKLSEYGVRLREKQKAKRFYGLTENQFRNTFEKAVLKKGIKGENFLRALELRFDNVIARLGLAPSRKEARQLILHGHFRINTKKVDIPSYQLKPETIISLNPKSVKRFDVPIELMSKRRLPAWLSFDASKKEGKILKVPSREEMDTPVNEQLVVEYYSR